MINIPYGSVRSLTPTVKTTHGWVRGENRQGVAVFRGIPYGGDVKGAHRFQPTGPAADWVGIRDCVPFGPVCPQRGGEPKSVCGSNFLGQFFSGGDPVLFQNSHEEPMDENCLVVNVQTPGIDDKKRPVLVYVHGGGFACGASDVMMGTPTLEAEEDIVVVGVNHRLNVYGFLYLGGLDPKYKDSGIVGMLDVVIALEWVRDNIAAFGGDPGNVTIMGESGGGGKVAMLLAMPEARGLFHKAIIESGSFPVGAYTAEMAAEATKKYLDKLGVGTNELDKLLEMSADQLNDTAWEMHYEPSPVGDGVHLPRNTEADYRVFPETAHVPVMIGMAAEEFAVFLPREIDNMTWEQLPGEILKLRAGGLGGRGVKATEENVGRVIEAFKALGGPDVTPSQVYFRVQSMGTFGHGCFVQTLERAKNAAAPVFSYLVTYAGPWPYYRHCAFHTQDLALQFRVVRDPESEPISKAFGHAWAAFCRTGSPSTPELPWPAFTAQERMTMILDNECRAVPDPLRIPREILTGER